MSDPEVEVVLVNIFGGILRCDVFAEGLLQAVRMLEVKIPVVVRMEGTNVEEGQRLLNASGFNFLLANGMAETEQKVIQALQG
jgi:succinyl-CoA synthetase beta subunit